MSELKQFKLPDVGEGLTEADIVKWHVHPGDKVTINQTIVEIETAKAVVELPSPYEGVVAGLLVPEGATADVGTPIIEVHVGPDAGSAEEPPVPRGGTSADLVPPPPAGGGAKPGHGVTAPGGQEKEERQSVLVGYGIKPGSTTRRRRKPSASAATPAARTTPVTPATSATSATSATPTTTPAPATPAASATAATTPGTTATPAPATPATPASPGRAADPASGTRGATSAPITASPGSAASPITSATPATPASATSSGPGNGAAARGAPVPAPGVLAKPLVRKLAKDLGIDLSQLSGTGPGGSITRDDVQSAAQGQDQAELADADGAPAAAATSPTQLAPVTAVAREERIPVRGVRKHTAEAMVGSAFSAPHVTEFLQIDITESTAATARLRALPEFSGVRVSPLLLVARALMVAVARYPLINSSWDDDAQEIVVRHYVNLGIAAATERGLIVPNIRDAHALSLAGLARALAELAETARAGKATPADLRGGTITITNVGVFGVDAGTPILTPGEAAILAFGRVRDAPWVHDGQLAVRKVTTLALSFDHRIVDGDLGSAVLRDIGAMLEDPLRMLAWS